MRFFAMVSSWYWLLPEVLDLILLKIHKISIGNHLYADPEYSRDAYIQS